MRLKAIYLRQPGVAFLSYVVYSDMAKVRQTMRELEHFPQLLLHEMTLPILAPDRHQKRGSAIQMAFCAHDIALCQLLLSYLDNKIDTDFYLRLHQQLQSLFPHGIEYAYRHWKPYSFASLAEIITQRPNEETKLIFLDKKNNGTLLHRALNEFRDCFNAVVDEERAFNPKHLIEAFDTYQRNRSHWNTLQRRVFWIRVVGVVQSHIPIPYARAYLFGLNKYVSQTATPKTEHLTFMKNVVGFYPSLSSDNQESGLGIDWAAIPWGYLRCKEGPDREDINISKSSFLTLVNKNLKEMSEFEQKIQRMAGIEFQCY